jgi:hypothetical protein
MKNCLLLTIAFIALFSSCKKEDHRPKDGLYRGPAVKVHNGSAWTTVQTDQNGTPLRFAITLDDAALNSVSGGGNATGHEHANAENNFNLKFHSKVNIAPFNYVGMNWNPDGHEPEAIYGLPHFDFHFYMNTQEQISAIPLYEMDSVKFKNAPAAGYLPQTYINPGGGVPQMGAHWVDVTSGEFNGQGFTQTFIYGSYDGKVNFYEPMITLAFLKNNSNFSRNIPQPAKVQKTGYYPTKLKVSKHDGVTDIIMDDLVYRVQS